MDAGMRQLLAEGWMHNRARMIVASFLTKTLYLDWRAGATYLNCLLWMMCGDRGRVSTKARNGYPAPIVDLAGGRARFLAARG